MRLDVKKMEWAFLCAAGWFPVALFSLFIKKVHVDNRYYQLLVSLSDNPDASSWTDRLFMYKDDIILGFFIIPLLIIVILYYSPKRHFALFASLIFSITILVLLYANLHSMGTVGSYLTYTAAIDAIAFGLQNPYFITSYIDLDSRVKFGFLLILVTGVFLGSVYLAKVILIARLLKYGVLISLVSSCVIFVLSFSSGLRSAPIINSVISSSFMAILSVDNRDSAYPYSDKKDLVSQFRKITNTPENIVNSTYFGTAKDNNLIVFVLETASSEFINLENDIKSFPAIEDLSGNSLIAYDHYSIFPASSESHFAIFYSVYPPRSYYNSCVVDNNDQSAKLFPGIIAALKNQGYRTNYYAPYRDAVPLDKVLHNRMGFETIYFAHDYERKQGQGWDELTFEKIKEDIRAFTDAEEKFAVVFSPQLGHAPWADRPTKRPIKEHGRLMAVRQMEWLGEIISMLRESGELDTTTIVVTGDHGIRTANEDPAFIPGYINEYSYKVPLFIYSARSFPKQLIVNSLTSHLDISPTLQDLFGVEREREHEQGLSLWHQNIDDRRHYFLASWYFGADGLRDGENYVMYSEALDIAFVSQQMKFDASNAVGDREVVQRVKSRVTSLYELQLSWLNEFLC